MHSTLIDVVFDKAQRHPEAEAFVFLTDGHVESARLTFGQLDLRARAIAAALSAKASRGDHVLLLFPPQLDFIEAFLGCLYGGMVAVPLPAPDGTRLKRTLPRIQAVSGNSAATVVLTTRTIAAMRDAICTQVPTLAPLHWLAVEDLPSSAARDWARPEAAATDLAYLQYSSGSTSAPKGIMISHANILHNVAYLLKTGQYDAGTVSVTWLPHFHDFGLVHGLLAPLCNGTLCYVMSPLAFLKRPVRWLQAMSRYKAAATQAPTFGYDHCLRHIRPEECGGLDLSHWRGTAISAEPVNPEIMRRFAERFAPFGLRRDIFCPAYGLAEATLVVTMDAPGTAAPPIHLDAAALERNRVVEVAADAPGARAFGGSGHIQPQFAVRIVDPETCDLLPTGRVGEIWCAGDSVAQGYWNLPDETERTFAARLASGETGRYLRTGDLGFVARGELFVTGRLKDLIIVGGANHYPQDIEWTAGTAHPSLRPLDSAAFAVPTEDGEGLVVAVEARAPREQFDDIHSAIRTAVINEHGVEPRVTVILPAGSLAKTSSGKIQRSACRAAFLAGDLEVLSDWRAPVRSALEAPAPTGQDIRDWLRRRFAAIAGVDPRRVDPNQPLTQFGMTSVEAVSTVAALEDWLQRDLSPTLLYQYPTINALSAWLMAEPQAPVAEPEVVAPSPQEPIAIIGIGCRFPGAAGPEAFWQMLRDGADAIREVPPDRWDADAFYARDAATQGRMNTRWGAFLSDVGDFDAAFFGISPREATRMDPQQRILLEVAVETFEHADVVPEHLAGTRTGVFVGISSTDYGWNQFRDATALDAHSHTGSALSIAANRISYGFDLRGPSLAVDTACSSSLTAVHLACESLRAGQSTLALAGGVNLILNPEVTVAAAQARMMSDDGRCKAFDARANGYVRGEGCGLVLLKRLTDAVRDGDRIVAVIRGSWVNQDGRSNGLTAPNPAQQRDVVLGALRNAGVAAQDLHYVEAHGTGTPLGDPIEFQALSDTIGAGRGPDDACLIGSVKTNIGHLEAAAGVAGLIKVALALAHEEIPPMVGFESINPHIRLEGSGLRLATERATWVRGDRPRRAGVSSFGMGGANSHAILEEAPPVDPPHAAPAAGQPHLLTLSGKTAEALLAAIRQYDDLLARDDRFAEIAHSSNIARSHFAHRLAIVAETSEEARRKLRDHTPGAVAGGDAPKVTFLFGDEGLRDDGPPDGALFAAPAFRAAVETCGAILKNEFALSPEDLLPGRDAGGAARMTGTALFVAQWALARLWLSWGILPDAVVAEGTGRFVAACLDGSMTLAEAIGATRAAAAEAARPADPDARLAALADGSTGIFLNIGGDPTFRLPARDPAASDRAEPPCLLAGGPGWRSVLGTLGTLYMQGAPIDWRSVAQDRSLPKVALPRYPFQRRRYWMKPGPKAESGPVAAIPPGQHPLLGERLRSPVIRDTVHESRIGTRSPPFLGDHVVYGQPVLPASAYLEMALAGMRARLPGPAPLALGTCTLSEALVLPETGSPVRLQTIFTHADAAGASFQVVSLNEADGSWRTHATGTVQTPPAAPAREAADLDAIRDRCRDRMTADELYAFLRQVELDYGPAFRGVTEVWRRKFEALGRVRRPVGKGDAPYVLDPVLLDSCFHLIVAAHPHDGVREAFVPTQIGALDVFGTVPDAFWVRVVVQPSEARSSPVIVADFQLFDDAGLPFAQITRATFRRVGREVFLGAAAQQDFRGWLYRPEWQTRESGYYEEQLDHGQWLILSDRGGVGDAIRASLEARGQHCTTAFRDDEVVIRSTPDLPLRGVIHLWALDGGEDQERICGSALDLVKSLLGARLATGPRVCLVSRGTQSTGPQDTASSAFGATLGGFANALAAEHPDLRVVNIDLDGQPRPGEAEFVIEEALTDDREARVAFRKGLRHVQRLVRIPLATVSRPQVALDGNATYLATGGLGGLGLQMAGWMIDRGARRIVLTGRSDGSAEAQARIDDWQGRGLDVVARKADVSDAGAVAALLADIARSGMPLRGIIHAAGVLGDGLVTQQDWPRFASVLRPKVQGAWNLHLQTQDLPLSFFLLVSSAAALMPNTGQASYSAANSFLDSLAHLRRGRGLAGLSVNWGAWEGAGLAAASRDRQRDRLAALGMNLIEPRAGLRALDVLLAADEAQLAVLPFDWTRFAAQVREGAEPPILAKLVADVRSRSADHEVKSEGSALLRDLERASPAERQDMVEQFIAEQVKKILGFEAGQDMDPSTGFFEIGLDSMMAVELQSRIQTGLGLSIPATTAFDQPNITALARFLLDKMQVSDTAPTRSAARPDDIPDAELFAILAEDHDAAATAGRGNR